MSTVITTSPATVACPSLSATRIVSRPLSGGLQVTVPVAALIVAPAGDGATSENVSVLAGRSGSVPAGCSETRAPSLTVSGPGTLNTGGRFTSFTWTVKVLASLSAGEPLSVTRTVME